MVVIIKYFVFFVFFIGGWEGSGYVLFVIEKVEELFEIESKVVGIWMFVDIGGELSKDEVLILLEYWWICWV